MPTWIPRAQGKLQGREKLLSTPTPPSAHSFFLLVLLISPLSDGYQSLGKCTQGGCAYILSSSLPLFSGREVLRPLP